jgi:hypothetical protein
MALAPSEAIGECRSMNELHGLSPYYLGRSRSFSLKLLCIINTLHALFSWAITTKAVLSLRRKLAARDIHTAQ